MVHPADNLVGSLTQWPLATHHGLGCGQLPAHLDEFVFLRKRGRVPAMTIMPGCRPFVLFGVRVRRGDSSRNLLWRSRASDAPSESRPAHTGSQCWAAWAGSCPTAESVTARSSAMSTVICVAIAYYGWRTKNLEEGRSQTPIRWRRRAWPVSLGPRLRKRRPTLPGQLAFLARELATAGCCAKDIFRLILNSSTCQLAQMGARTTRLVLGYSTS